MEGTVSIRVIRSLLAVAEARGASRTELLGAAELSAKQLLDDDARVPSSTSIRTCVAAIEVTGDPAFGLHWAESLTEGSFPPISNIFVHASDLRDAFGTLQRFSRLLSDDAKYEVAEGQGEVVLKRADAVEGPLCVRRLRAEMFTLGLLDQIRRVVPRARPSVVSFEYPEPAYRAEYTRVFEHAERFGQPFTGLVFSSAVLDGHSPNQDDEMKDVLRSLAELRLSRITRSTSYAHRVRDALVHGSWPNGTDMQRVARQLHVSVRSLRRRLATEGVRYDAVCAEARAAIAMEMLRNEERTIQDVSDAMGFADKSTFHRAFKRWTGSTPNEYRRRDLRDP